MLRSLKRMFSSTICADNPETVCYTGTMAQFSFDVISSYDKAEMNNVYQQAEKEIASRYDFRGTAAGIEWLADKKGIKAIADSPLAARAGD